MQRAVLRSAAAETQDAEAARRRRRRRRRSSRRRSRRRRRRSEEQTTTEPPAAQKADARATGVEAGWANMAKTNGKFTAFITGTSLDPEKDRIVVIHGEHRCGDTTAKLAAVTGKGESPGQSFAAWRSLRCDGLGSSDKKLACGEMHWSDDGYVDAYKFEVCVCDYSKKGRCTTMEDFDLSPTISALKLEPVV